MNRSALVKTKLSAFFCLLVFGAATAFAQRQPNVDEPVQKQTGERKMPNAAAQLKSTKTPIYSGEKQSQTTALTGTYFYKGEGRANKIKILQTGAGEIKVSFEGIYQFKIPGGHLNTRTGDIEPQTIRLEKGRRAVLTAEDATDCRVTLTFLSNGALKAVQSASGCEFPAGVTADGIYRKTSAKKPQFLNYSHGAPAAILEDAAGKTPDSLTKRVRFPKGADSVIVSGKLS